MPNVLVVVDMQYEFDASDFVKDQVVELIAKRRAEGWKIMILEYQGFGPTIKEIRGDFHAIKDEDSAANVVDKMLTDLNIHPRYIEVCGVNRFACVEDTHYGLQELGYYSIINEKASADENIINFEDWAFTNRYGYLITYYNGKCHRTCPKTKKLKSFLRRKFNRFCRLLRLK